MDYKKLVLPFSIDNIWNICRLKSANIANHISSQTGTTQEGSLTLTDSERVLFDVELRYPADSVYNYLMSAGKVSEVGYQYNYIVSGVNSIQYTLYVNSDWDKNLTRALNNYIEQALVAGALSRWFLSCRQFDDAKILNNEMTQALQYSKITINKSKIPLKTPYVTF